MTQQIQGYAEAVNKQKTGYFGILVDGTWYGIGKSNSKNIEKGDQVRFDATQNDKGYWQAVASTIQVKKGEAPQTSNKSYPKKTFKSGGVKDDYWAKKEERDVKITQPLIMYQNAGNVAAQLLSASLAVGAMDLGKVPKNHVVKLEGYFRELRDSVYNDLLIKNKELEDGKPQLEEAEDDVPEIEKVEQPKAAEAEATTGFDDLEDDEDWD